MEFNSAYALAKIENLASVTEFAFVPVSDSDSEKEAAIMLSAVRKRIKETQTERLTWTRPLDELKKRFMAKADEYIQPLIRLDNALDKALTDYRIKLEDIRKKEEARLLALSQKRTERAIKNGRPPPLPEEVIPFVSMPDKTVHSNDGSKVTYTKHYKAYLVNIEQVPLYFNGVQLLEVNMTQIQKLVNAGLRDIPGIEVKEEIGTRVG